MIDAACMMVTLLLASAAGLIVLAEFIALRRKVRNLSQDMVLLQQINAGLAARVRCLENKLNYM